MKKSKNDEDKLLQEISIEEKYNKIIEWFQIEFKKNKEKILVALSGGVDSAVVAMVAKHALGKENVLAITANYQTLSNEELDTAVMIARELEINHKIIEYNELENPEFIKNDDSRCFHCRNELANNLLNLSNKENFKLIVDGSNTDDLNDYRPGMIALHEKGVKSPLIETGCNKKEIRRLAEINNLSVYDKPSNACLASRISRNIEITVPKLKRIEKCESMIKKIFDIKQVRVRDHGDLARIEVEKEELVKLFDINKINQIEIPFKEHGFKYITIDIEGYRKSGSNISNKIENLNKKRMDVNNDIK